MAQSNTLAHSVVSAFKVEPDHKIAIHQIQTESAREAIKRFNVAFGEAQIDGGDRFAIYHDSLSNIRFTADTAPLGSKTYYVEGTMPAGVTSDGELYRLGIGNELLNEQSLTVIQKGPVAIWRWIIGIVLASLVATVIIGGIRRIGHVASVLTPFMSVVYVLSALIILVIKAEDILPAFQLIFHHAFNPTAVVGGSATGATVWMTISWGLRRGLFSNEAGQGSAAMAHSTARVKEPVREGLVAMLGPFIDTILICTMTALVIISTGVWDSGLNGAELTMTAFDKALPIYGEWMVVVGIVLFAFSTVIAWSYYGEKGIEFLAGKKAKLPYKWVFVLFTLLGARLDLEAVWSYADTANGLMAVPNLVALIGLSGAVVGITRKYMREKREGIHIPFKQRSKQ
ncbi:amino acid carrier protein [candidate division GN15 bacterium]|nr:amino acid carrier protein [candidate division GN15 bacterium]